MRFTAIIVDDERLAREELSEMLRQIDDIQVIGEASNLAQATELITQHNPDIVFLDIQLRHENGFNLLNHVEHNFHLIFVTAFDAYAIRAFEINAFDYLLKPINPKRLNAVIHKLQTFEATQPTSSTKNQQTQLNMNDRLLVNLGDRSIFLAINTISHICASGDYSEVFVNDANSINSTSGMLVEKPLKEWQNRLPETSFIRIHRSTIVNIARIDSVKALPNRTMHLFLMDCKTQFCVSRRYAAKLKETFS